MNQIKFRKVNYLGVQKITKWSIKMYVTSTNTEVMHFVIINRIKQELEKWIADLPDTEFINKKAGIVIFHSWPDGMYAWLICWNKYDSATTNFYFRKKGEDNFTVYSDKSMIDYIQEFAIVFFESNEWNKYIISKRPNVNMSGYLHSIYNDSAEV